MKENKQQRLPFIFLNRLLSLYFNIEAHHTLRKFLSVVYSLLKKNGTLWAITYLKQCRLHITRYICGNPLYSNDKWVALKGGFPVKLYFLKELIDSGKLSELKLVLTLLIIPRAIRPLKEESIPIKFNTITDPYKGKKYTIPQSFIKDFVKHYNLSQTSPIYSQESFYLSNKSGPAGPSILSSITTLMSYTPMMIKRLAVFLGEDSYLIMNFYRFAQWYPHIFKFSGGSRAAEESAANGDIGRLAIVNDPECKMRVIAMSDYFTQVILRGIHDKLFNCLRKFPCDRTFTQDPKHLWEENGYSYWSLDLTAATDRFPILLEAKLLKYIFNNKRLVNMWKYLLHGRSYVFDGVQYSYSVGQPMGCYSSWASFTVTHHLVVAWAAHLTGFKLGFNQYILLGDDIVIKNDIVARKYISIMNRLGVDISMHKTHVSKDTYEFAKRWLQRGTEITGLPIRGILDNVKSFKVVYTMLLTYILRGNMYIASLRLDDLIIQLYSGLKFNRKRKLIRFDKTFLTEQLTKFVPALRYSFGLSTTEEERNLLLDHWEFEEYPIPCENCIPSVMKAVAQEGALSTALRTIYTFQKQLDKFKYLSESNVRIVNPWLSFISLIRLTKWLPLYISRPILKYIQGHTRKVYDPRWYFYHPIFFASVNQIERTVNRIKSYITGFNTNFVDLVIDSLFDDKTDLFSTDRTKSVVEYIDSKFVNSFKLLGDWVKFMKISDNITYYLEQREILSTHFSIGGFEETGMWEMDGIDISHSMSFTDRSADKNDIHFSSRRPLPYYPIKLLDEEFKSTMSFIKDIDDQALALMKQEGYKYMVPDW